MQYKNEKTLIYIKTLGSVIHKKRIAHSKDARYNFCNSYELDSSNLRRIENGEIEPKITMLWRISEALNISLSELIKDVERELGNDFHVIEQ